MKERIIYEVLLKYDVKQGRWSQTLTFRIKFKSSLCSRV